jgi:phosphate transport system substrate-binding protein
MQSIKALVCPKCTYDANPVTATHCEQCHHPLPNASLPPHALPESIPSSQPQLIPSSQPNTLVPIKPLSRPIPASQERPEPLFSKRFVPILLLFIAAELFTFFLAWLLFGNRPAQVADGSTQTNPNCIAPPSVKGDRVTYAQICSAMREVLNVPDGQFFYGGTMAAAAMRSPKVVENILQSHPEFRLRYADPLSVAPDSQTGIRMVINGDLSFAESQRSLRETEYAQAQSRGFTLKQVPVALTGIVFFTHPDLQIAGLSLSQLQAIYTGEITNWQEVGGPDLPIVPVSQDQTEKGSTIALLMEGLPPEHQRLGDTIKLVRDNTAAIRDVAKIPGAIGYGIQAVTVGQRTIRLIGIAKGNSKNYIQASTPDGQINREVIRDGTYPLIQRIFVIIRQDGTLDELAGVAYANLLLSKEGQQLVDTAGYQPIR